MQSADSDEIFTAVFAGVPNEWGHYESIDPVATAAKWKAEGWPGDWSVSHGPSISRSEARFRQQWTIAEATAAHVLRPADVERDIPVGDPLRSAFGVYAIWQDTTLLYIGKVATVPSTSPSAQIHPDAVGRAARASGLHGRLRDHARGDIRDVWLHYALRRMIPEFGRDDLANLAEGGIAFLHSLVVQKIKTGCFAYRAVVTDSPQEATAGEIELRRWGLPASQALPLLNRLEQ